MRCGCAVHQRCGGGGGAALGGTLRRPGMALSCGHFWPDGAPALPAALQAVCLDDVFGTT